MILAPRRALLGGLLAAAALAAPAHAATVQVFDVPTNDSNLRGLTLGGDGALWFTERKGLKLGRLDPASAKISEFPVAPDGGSSDGSSIGDDGPDGITTATDGSVWFYSDIGDTIYKVTPSATPSARLRFKDQLDNVDGIGPAPGGGVWATFAHGDGDDNDDDGLMRLPDSGNASFFAASYLWRHPLALGPDGNAWFGDGNGSDTQLKRIAANGQISNTPIPTPSGHQISSIAFAPDGSTWFTAFDPGTRGYTAYVSASGGVVGKLGGAVTPVNGPSGGGNSLPRSLVKGPDGGLWWAEAQGIGRIDPSTGAVREGSIAPYNPDAIAFDSSGGLWFIDSAQNKIGKITIDGNLFAPPPTLPTLPAQPGTPPAAGTPTTTPAQQQPLAPAISLSVARQKLRSVRSRKSIPVSCTLRGAGTCSVTLSVSAATKRSLKLSSTTLGSARHRFTKAGKATLTVRLSAAVLRGLKRARRSVTVTLRATSSGTNLRPRTNVRELTLRR